MGAHGNTGKPPLFQLLPWQRACPLLLVYIQGPAGHRQGPCPVWAAYHGTNNESSLQNVACSLPP